MDALLIFLYPKKLSFYLNLATCCRRAAILCDCQTGKIKSLASACPKQGPVTQDEDTGMEKIERQGFASEAGGCRESQWGDYSSYIYTFNGTGNF